MNSGLQPKTKNYFRRVFWSGLAFSPLVILLVSLVFGIMRRNLPDFAAIGFMIPAAVLAFLNFYLSFIRPRFYFSRHGSMAGYRFKSGVPLVGTLLVVLGAVFGFGSIWSTIIGIIAFSFDTGGSGWFVIATWRDQSLWDS